LRSSTISSLVLAARHRLREAGLAPEEADLDARLLAEHVLGWTTERFLTDARTPPPRSFASRYEALVGRRARHEPIAYIVGRQEFWGLDFLVTPAVLIPRPETEGVVECALAFIDHARPAADGPPKPRARDRALEIADLCTGSGCIAVALACERADVEIAATDVSRDALALARRNALRHQVADRVSVHRGDLFADLAGPFDLVVANPPYVPERDRPSLAPTVREYEPPGALFAGPDGLDLVRRLVGEAPNRLRPGGGLVFEFGFGQGDDVSRLIGAAPGLRLVELRPDLQGIPRVAFALRA
jgi:release factor glutamine methyltransferase